MKGVQLYSEIKNRKFIIFNIHGLTVILLVLGLIILTNYGIDASAVVTSGVHKQMARLALTGNIVATPENYNERVYQTAIIEEMREIPETIVIGSSRGMYLGEEITGRENLYNHCVSGGCLEDNYAILGLYYQKFETLPRKIILEVSPWLFYRDIPEKRWMEDDSYASAAESFYKLVNNSDLVRETDGENPFLSLSYFQYNIYILMQNGFKAFIREEARISTDPSESADCPDGTIRYTADLENYNKERLEIVQSITGALTYQNADQMTEMDFNKIRVFENLLDYLLSVNTDIIVYMAPFSDTQCHYIYDENTNPVFEDVEVYLNCLRSERNIEVIGSYDARSFNLSDEYFVDNMHPDKNGTKIVWSSKLD